jgi:hypothetical protein
MHSPPEVSVWEARKYEVTGMLAEFGSPYALLMNADVLSPVYPTAEVCIGTDAPIPPFDYSAPMLVLRPAHTGPAVKTTPIQHHVYTAVSHPIPSSSRLTERCPGWQRRDTQAHGRCQSTATR